MKQSHLLILLLLLAAGAGALIYRKPEQAPAAIEPALQQTNGRASITSFLEEETGLSFLRTPTTKIVSGPEILEAVNRSLEKRYGAKGLQYRNRVFELLGLLPTGRSLAEELLIAQTAAKPGWFDVTTGIIYLHEKFQGVDSSEQAALVHLKARALLHQHHPPPERPLTDDAYNMREAIHGGIACIMEAKFRASDSSNASLPSQAEMEREAALLSLPIYLHNLTQLPAMQGKDYVESELSKGKSIRSILAEEVKDTLVLFSQQAPDTMISDPEFPDILLSETLGAYTTQLIGERLADYVTAEQMAEAWRGDRYFYSTSEQGENLCWVSQWDSIETAKKVEDLIRSELIEMASDNPVLTNPFIRQTNGQILVIYFSDQRNLQKFILPFQKPDQ